MMRRFVWFFVGVFLAAGPMLAFAEDYPAVFYLGVGTGKYSTPSSWFAAWAPTQSTCTTSGCSCSFTSSYTSGNQEIVTYNRVCPGLNNNPTTGTVWNAWCPSGGTLSGSYPNTMCVGAPPCPAGTVRGSDGVCAAPPCQAGTQYSTGYYDYGLQPDSKMTTFGCADGCEVTFSGDAPAGRQLVGGVYHYFARGSYNRTGTACTSGPSVSPSTPAIPPAGCGPNQGSATMNGKTVCVDEATGTQTNPYAPKPTPETTENKTTTTNPDGSTTTVTETCTGPNACTTTTQTCTGPNSCTSTTTTTGGGSGGGGGPGPGTSRDKDFDADGTPDFDAEGNPVDPEQDNLDQCQKTPNAAMCKEKIPIDEEGVSTDADTKGMTSQKNTLDEKANELKAQLEGRSWERSDLGFTWNPGFPSGSCSAIEIANQSIDVCKPLGYVRDLWNYVCVFLAALAIWIRGTGALRGA